MNDVWFERGGVYIVALVCDDQRVCDTILRLRADENGLP